MTDTSREALIKELRVAAELLQIGKVEDWDGLAAEILQAADMMEADAQFDTWAKSPYTLVLQKSIAEDYEPKQAQQVAVLAWAATADKMPEPLNKVLAFNGKKQPIRAMWVPAKTLEDSGDGDFGEYDEATDQTYWPEGWYETNAYEEAHWLVDGQVTHWMPLPAAPQGAKP